MRGQNHGYLIAMCRDTVQDYVGGLYAIITSAGQRLVT
jgi:hypothetical protein